MVGLRLRTGKPTGDSFGYFGRFEFETENWETVAKKISKTWKFQTVENLEPPWTASVTWYAGV